MMSIDEAITLLKFNNKHIADLKNDDLQQLAEWLEELNELRKYSYAQGHSDGYNNAIDDFAEGLTTYLGVENATKYGNKDAEQQRNSYDTLMKYEIADAIDDIAEQLKEGGENGTDNQ